ncbi:MAG: isoamylase early set domain-containing protein [Prolixibacteraceae bacterium]|nr:isoamylase early set domain-containing protein [Prolixibacteraceae bacterium]
MVQKKYRFWAILITGINLLNQLKSNDFSATLELESGKEYQFRYLIDGANWKNDSDADGFVTNEFGAENCVISTQA